MNKINQKSWEWIEENREIQDPRVLWDFLKYKIHYEMIVYSKKKAKDRRSVLVSLEERLKECQLKCDEDPTPENLNNLEITQTEYDRHYDYITQGIFIRSKVNWYEQGEKSNKFFLHLENAKKKKSSIRKLSMDNDKEMTEPKQIMTEIHNFYSKLYDKDSYKLGDNSITGFLDKMNSKKLSNDQREVLDKKLTRSEL